LENGVPLATKLESEESGTIALNFMAFLARDEERLSRFCALSGFREQGLKSRANDPNFHGFLLDYALSDESLLLAFAADSNLKPERVVAARRALPGFAE
jgi:hypothetical protein